MDKECCICGTGKELFTVRGRDGEVTLCSKHLTEELGKALKLETFKGRNICCDIDTGGFYAVDTGNHRLMLCRKHLIDMVCRCLDSDVFMNLYDLLGIERTGLKLFNEEFYMEDGTALEPMYSLARYYYAMADIDARENIIENLISDIYSIQADCRTNGICDRKTQELFERLMNSVETVEENMNREPA